MAKRYWLMKSEPGTYSIDDLARDGRTHWDGIRNYQARNLMRDEMRVGDEVLFYHSSTDRVGVVGLARVVREAYPDPTARDPNSKYFDPKASDEDPRWFMVDIEFVEKFDEIVPLATLKETPGLEKMLVTTKSRLSIQPVTEREFEVVKALAGKRPVGA
ncbi:MAG TPA: EVE domain-containing protein [Longimicrobiales bacterium]